MEPEELKERDFNRKIDYYLSTGQMIAEDYESCTITQKIVLQTIKRSFKRILKYEPN